MGQAYRAADRRLLDRFYPCPMCGRYTHLFTWSDLRRLLGLMSEGNEDTYGPLKPSYNVAPTQAAPILKVNTERNWKLEGAVWGLTPKWMDKAGPINARSETAATNAVFRSAFKNGRCVVPVSAFYEWKPPPEGKGKVKQPFYITRADGEPLLFAGLRDVNRENIQTFAILTTSANAFMADIHDRMPVILEPERARAWIESPDPALLVPAADGVLTARPVSTFVNKPANNSPECIKDV